MTQLKMQTRHTRREDSIEFSYVPDFDDPLLDDNFSQTNTRKIARQAICEIFHKRTILLIRRACGRGIQRSKKWSGR